MVAETLLKKLYDRNKDVEIYHKQKLSVVERQRSKTRAMSKSKSQAEGVSPSKFSQGDSPLKFSNEESPRKLEKGAATEVVRKSMSEIKPLPSGDQILNDSEEMKATSEAEEEEMHEIDMIT